MKKAFICIVIIAQFIFIWTGSMFFSKSAFANSPFTFTVTQDNNWGTGFCYQFTTENTSTDPVSNWVVGFDLWWGNITSSFGGVFTNNGNTYEITSPWAYADPLAASQSISMWFCGTGIGWVSNLELKNYSWMWVIWPTVVWSTLQDYSITFEWLKMDVVASSSWATWYCRDITLENISTSDINNWELNFKLDQALSSSYSGNFTQSWTSHTVTPLAWNQTLTPSQSLVIGFCSNGTTYDYDWTISLNGQTSSLWWTSGLQIGTGSVVGDASFDAVIDWNDTYTAASASGQVTDILIKARVLPSLNMSISTAEIDLGDLSAGVASAGSLFLEIGTNAKSGVSITARSQSGGLTNTTDAAVQINDLTTDGVAESYTWASTPAATDDASSPAFAATGLGALEVNDIVTEHVVYSTNKAEATNLVDDVEFVVSATTTAETPAGEYEDFVTFTVTGNF